MSFCQKPRRTSRRSIGERHLRVRRCGVRHIPGRSGNCVHVQVAGSLEVRLLRLEVAAGKRGGEAPGGTQQAGPIPDLVNRDFSAAVPGAKMVGDITYIPTWEGWVYLATVIDCATRKVIGWAMDDNYRTPLITSAIEMAARNLDLPADAIFHSDRGSNYTSGDFGAVLKRLGIRQSVGRTGICF